VSLSSHAVSDAEPAALPVAGRRAAAAAPGRHRTGLWLLLAPFLLGATLLVALPALFTVVLAFTDYDALSPPVWVGGRNFADLAHDNLFWTAARNSAVLVFLAVPLRTLAALALALLLVRRRRGTSLYRCAVFLPTVIPDVAYALIWLWILNPLYGPLNMVLGLLGLPQPAWLADPDTALLAIVLSSLFQIGEGFVLLLAGLQYAPQDCYDAAAIDGAGRWQVLRHITLPLLAPWLLLLAIRDILVVAQASFTPALIMTGGGPYYATFFMPLLVYEEAFDRFRFGDAAAIMLLMYASLGLLLYLIHLVLKGRIHVDEI
jgi:multiple sugar transport system permease protein